MEFSAAAFGLQKYSIPTPILKKIIGDGAFINTAVELFDYILADHPGFEFFSLPRLCNALTVETFEDLIREADEPTLDILAVNGRTTFLETVREIAQERKEFIGEHVAKNIDSVVTVLTSLHMEDVLRRTLGLVRPNIAPATTYGHSPLRIALGEAHRISPEETWTWIHALTTQAIDYFLYEGGDDRDPRWKLPKVAPIKPIAWRTNPFHQQPTPAIHSDIQQETAMKTKNRTDTSLIPRPKARKSSSAPSQKAELLQNLAATTKSPAAKKRAKRGAGSKAATSRSTSGPVPAPADASRRKSARF